MSSSDPHAAGYDRHGVAVYLGDCRDVLAGWPGASVHAVVCDPPYELAFMGRSWDESGIAFDPTVWAECLRVLTPGGHLLAFGGARTWHRLAVAIEDAGFELRDSIAWLYGSGFPKSHDVSKAIDKAAGAERDVVATIPDRWAGKGEVLQRATQDTREDATVTTPATEAARQWQGWGTALKPGFEPIVVARKPLSGTVADTVQQHGTGGLNIDGCRVGTGTGKPKPEYRPNHGNNVFGNALGGGAWENTAGRWPANVALGHTADCGQQCTPSCPVAVLDEQSGTVASGANPTRRSGTTFSDAYGEFAGQRECAPARGADSGGASRFFPCFRWEAKAGPGERPRAGGVAHPTVKPLALMRWLVRLVTPPGGTVLDPFAGSGATLQAARAEGRPARGIELEADHLPLIRARLDDRSEPRGHQPAPARGPDLLDLLDQPEDADTGR